MPGNQGLEHQDKLQSKIPTTTAWYSGFRHLCSWYSALSPSQDSEPSSGCCQYGLILTQAAGFSRGVALGWWEPLRQQVHHTPPNSKTRWLKDVGKTGYKSSSPSLQGDHLGFYPLHGVPLESGWHWAPAESTSLSSSFLCHFPHPSPAENTPSIKH